VGENVQQKTELMMTGYQDHKVYFNGCKQEDVHNSNRIGTHGKILNLWYERLVNSNI